MTIGSGFAAHVHSPLKYPAFQRRSRIHHPADPVVNAIENLRHTDLNGGTQFLKILHQFIDAFGISAHNPEVHRRINGHSLQHMGQGKKGHSEIVFFIMVHLRGIHHRMVKIGVGDDGPFWRSRGSGCVGNRSRIGRPDGPPDIFKTGRVGIVSLTPAVDECFQRDRIGRKRLGHRIKKHHLFGQTRFRPNGKKLIQKRFVFHKTDLQAAVRNNMRHLPETGRRVKADGHAAGGQNGHVGFTPLHSCAAGNADGVPFSNPRAKRPITPEGRDSNA